MSLYEALKRRGYTFRQHLEEESWGWRKIIAADLDIMQREALEREGVPGLKAVLAERVYRPPWGLWTFPDFEIEKPLPRRPDLTLARAGRPSATVVAPRAEPALWAMAQEWVRALRERHGVELPLLGDDEAGPELLATRDVLLFGGSHQNRLALEFALRLRTFFVDAGVPGDDGWVATTHCGVHASGHNIAQVAAPAERRAEALAALSGALAVEGDALLLRRLHRVVPGAFMAANFPSWEKFVSALPGRLPQLAGRQVEAPADPAALAEFLAVGLDSGGLAKSWYNVAPVDIANDAARYYQLSADPRALKLFRELLYRLADYYLKTPGGASYPADLDFRLGLLVLNFARLEHGPLFDDDDRLILANLLLACTRSIHEYAVKFWPARRCAGARHNHQTFPALSLAYAADYFSRYNLPQVAAWRAYAEDIFSGPLWRRGKQCENSRAYEPYVFEHAAAYSAFLGRGLSLFEGDGFEQMVRRQIAATDNFFRPVDYGDTAISLQPVDPPSARFLATRLGGVVRWYAAEGFARRPEFVPNSFIDCPGLRPRGGAKAPETGDWERMPLDPLFIEEVAPGLPREFAFDKLAFRTGWGDEDQYLLLEGVTGNVSHAHRDTLGLVRYNHLGRHWLVSNGYGRPIGVTNASKAFSARQLGPEDHNTLVLRRADGPVRDMPCGALLQCGRNGAMLYATAALAGYGGADWLRTLVLRAGGYLLVVDRVRVREPGLTGLHVEWNLPGRAEARDGGWRVEQKGVFLDVTSPSGWRMETAAGDRSACWKRALDSGEYPHAAFPLARLLCHAPGAEAGQTHCLATLLAATRGAPRFILTQQAPGILTVAGPHSGCADAPIEAGDLTLLAREEGCEVRFHPEPEIPAALAQWRHPPPAKG
jgi:hypothetical protein